MASTLSFVASSKERLIMDNQQVAQILGNLTVMELISLTKELETKWGVKAVPQVSMLPTDTPLVQPVVEQTEFSVILVSHAPDKKMFMVKAIREILGLGILESKNLVESLPKPIKEGLNKTEAEALKTKLTEVGGNVEIK